MIRCEECTQAVVAELLPNLDSDRRGVCIDVGVGTFSFYCQTFAELGFTTLAIEPMPVPEVHTLCKTHNIKLIEACLSDHDGTQTLYLGAWDGKLDANFNTLKSSWFGASQETKEVVSFSLQGLLNSFHPQKVTCLKLDVEGYEAVIINQLAQLPDYLVPDIVVFEYSSGSAEFSGAAIECLKILQNLDYRTAIIIDASTREKFIDLKCPPVEIDKIFSLGLSWGNIVALRYTLYPAQPISNVCAPYYEAAPEELTPEESSGQEEANVTNYISTYLEQIEADGEAGVIRNYIEPDQVIFDIGAGAGEWTKTVLDTHSGSQVHVFEPLTILYPELNANLGTAITNKQVVFNSAAVAATVGSQTFYYYENHPYYSTLFRSRPLSEEHFAMGTPQELQVLGITLDTYCQQHQIKRIHFAKIAAEGAELEVLRGAEKLLAKGKIDYLQFEYGGTYLESGISLQAVFAYLQHYQYLVFKIQPNGLEFRPEFLPTDEDFQYANYLAVHERFRALIIPDAEKWLDWGSLARYNAINPVEPRGVLHVGAHLGGEVWAYHNMGLKTAVFIEANPEVFPGLEGNLANYRQYLAENNLTGLEKVVAVHCAASNENGTVNFRITSLDQSSSILPLKIHSEVYPEIEETHQVEVVAKTLDTILEELEIHPAEVNLINFDIQGAELLALQGATNLLKYVDAINTEVSYVELYEGCGLIDDMDDFLEQYGFVRIATTTPYHRTWGDAFYIKRGVITMSCLGNLGRFGNSLLQYVYLKTYAKLYNLRVETPEWIGQYLFGHSDPPISRELPQFSQFTSNENHYTVLDGLFPQPIPPFRNVDFYALAQIHHSYYTINNHQDYYKFLFQPKLDVKTRLEPLWEKLRSRGMTVVGIHLRRGDYITSAKHLHEEMGWHHLYAAPSEWYLEWLKEIWSTLDSPVLFIASDDIDDVVEDFAEYNPVTSKILGADFPEAEFYPDFYLLSKCDILAISNSTFSFMAAVLNEEGRCFMRPYLPSKKLISFLPWKSCPILIDC
ncbi:MAG: FkbM family methyltransferase [Coleofasciculaceae cyanobacterium SM2_1_6]|nr:FkbM family methyltransferase [Coleofasciculaceae cyanobacterium SM2_1_6]